MRKLLSTVGETPPNETALNSTFNADIRMEGIDEKDGMKDITDKLLDTRQIFLTGGIDEKQAKKIITWLLMLEADDPEKPIILFVNSPGGSVNDGFAIYDTIRFIRPTVHIICSGLCASIATIILIATEKKCRLSLPNARLLIHQPLIYGQVIGPASDLEITATEILKARKKINVLLAAECGQSLKKVERDTQRDFWMNAEEAIEYGLVSKIVTTRSDLPKIK